jgi:galactitol-specific phosphotransferase system IIB component
MNPLSFYERSKVPWTVEESEEVRKEYETDLLNIIEIGNKHTRTPGCIAYKLKNLGLIVHNALSRGYTEYKTSTLYIEICKEYKKGDEEKKLKNEKKLKVKGEMTKTDIIHEIKHLKEEISEIKKDIKQMLSYITSIYEFEKEE